MMAMYYWDFLERVINDGIEAAKADYTSEDNVQSAKLEGSIAGFEACRDCLPEKLGVILIEARQDARESMLRYYSRDQDLKEKDYWYWRCFELEVEWVCNVVSAMLFNEGKPVIIPPTSRGMTKVAEILGVSNV